MPKILAFGIACIWVGVCVRLWVLSRRIGYLKNMNAGLLSQEPPVAIVIAVKDEEAELEQALRSVCQLDYKNYTIVVVNDRSEDRTPEILSRMQQAYPAIRIITITELPTGWLGKNHALYQGHLATDADWLLFTDADVLYGKQALKKAMVYANDRNLDHLTILPEITSRSALFVSVLNTFAMMLELRLRPWAASNPKSTASVGIGAFNLIRRSGYMKIGTHLSISLRPDDDLKLGERVKKAGLKQDVLYGESEVSLAWYSSLGEFINGLMKNSFAVINYNLAAALGGAVGTFVAFVLPVPLLLSQDAICRGLALIILAAQTLLMVSKKGIHGRWWHALMIPFAGLIMVYIILESALRTIRQRGIYWRNSFYSLTELRSQK